MSGSMPSDGEDVSELFGQLSVVIMLAAVVLFYGVGPGVGAAIAIGWVLVIAGSLYGPVGPVLKWSSPASRENGEWDFDIGE